MKKRTLAILLTVVILVSMFPITASAADNTVNISGTLYYSYAFQVLDYVNQERAAEGLSALTMSKAMLNTAMIRAIECVVRFDHTRPNDERCFSAFPSGSYRGENIAMGYRSASNVMTGWMNSPGHRANILDSGFQSIGIGCFYHNGILYWSQCFTSSSATDPVSSSSYSDCNTISNVNVGSSIPSLLISGYTAMNTGTTQTLLAYMDNWETFQLDSSCCTWTSSNPSVVSVDASGMVTAKNAGTATITVKAGSGSASLTITVEKYFDYAWVKSDGKWFYYIHNQPITNQFRTIDGNVYYFDESGAMRTGWEKIDGKWYYFNASGAMQTGWQKINGSWYYFKSNGIMATGWEKINGTWYYLKSAGAMATGWEKINGTWYYFAPSGAMQTGWQKINSTWYYLKPSGAMATGWEKINGEWYYLKSSGAMATGWEKIDIKWYYFMSSGKMVTGDYTINGTVYHFNSSGAWIQ